jgi:hypothetical protein
VATKKKKLINRSRYSLLKQSNFAATSSCSPPQHTLQPAAAARPPHLDAAGAATLDAVIRTPRHAAACRTLKCHRTPWSLHYRVASAQQERGRERIGEGMDLPVTESSRKGDHPFLPSLPPFRSIPAATTVGAPAAAATLRSKTSSVHAPAVLVPRLHSSQGRGGPGCVPPGPAQSPAGISPLLQPHVRPDRAPPGRRLESGGDLGFHRSRMDMEADGNERPWLSPTTGPLTEPVPGVMNPTKGYGSVKKIHKSNG